MIPAPYFERLRIESVPEKLCSFLNGKPVSPDTISRNSRKLLSDCGFENIKFHDLRHTAVTLLAKEKEKSPETT